MNKAIFLDTDGTLIENLPDNVNPDLVVWKKNTISGLHNLQEFGYLFIIVANQSGVADGYFHFDDVSVVRSKMERMFFEVGLAITDYYFCPHDVNGTIKEYARHCPDHKPLPGMILKAAHRYQIDLFHSWVIGDTLDDIEAGNRAGCQTIFLNNGGEQWWLPGKFRKPNGLANDVDEAADLIIQHSYFNSIFE